MKTLAMGRLQVGAQMAPMGSVKFVYSLEAVKMLHKAAIPVLAEKVLHQQLYKNILLAKTGSNPMNLAEWVF